MQAQIVSPRVVEYGGFEPRTSCGEVVAWLNRRGFVGQKVGYEYGMSTTHRVAVAMQTSVKQNLLYTLADNARVETVSAN